MMNCAAYQMSLPNPFKSKQFRLGFLFVLGLCAITFIYVITRIPTIADNQASRLIGGLFEDKIRGTEFENLRITRIHSSAGETVLYITGQLTDVQKQKLKDISKQVRDEFVARDTDGGFYKVTLEFNNEGPSTNHAPSK